MTERFGENARDRRGLRPWGQRRLGHLFSALEVACLDLAGKATGRPVVDLLGGPSRDRVDFSAYLYFKHADAGDRLGFGQNPAATGWSAARQAEALDPEAIVDQAQAMVRTFGFQSIKLKGGTLEPEVEVAAIRARRDTLGPEVPLRFDPNAVWSVDTAIAWGQRLEGPAGVLRGPHARPAGHGPDATGH